MVILSKDGSVEVTVSSKPDANGRFTVSARQLTADNILAYINVVFSSNPENSTRIKYETQNQTKTWPVNGSHAGDVITSVEISISTKEQK
jgi:hypothetical protein